MAKNKVLLSELNEGALQERFNFELAQVAKNILDPNTDPEKKRKITIDITVLSDEYREGLVFDCQVKSKLAPRQNVTSKVIIGKNAKGEVVANELKSGQLGQMYFDPVDSELKDDKGTPVSEIEKIQETDKIKKFKTN
ncbi:hypothetical protein IGJ28_000725 [Enterococcus sp. AZ091]|uniref:hypothetical protein n=1 Tax=Enterococcus sp. AZ091 TaxID=2774720 RepID=UPI003F235538